MSLRVTIPALAVALGAMLLLAIAPETASAHPGHGHSLVEKVAAKAPPAPQPRAERTASSRNVATVRAAPALPSSSNRFHPGCADPNCCGNGHCLSFAGVIAPLAMAEFLDHDGALPAGFNMPPPRGRVTKGPSRPPKSFA
jgi:hypothetical protein